MQDGSRKVTSVSEVIGIEGDDIEQRPIFEFVRTSTDKAGRVAGDYRATGYLPSYLDEFIVLGFVRRGEPFL
jgi:pilus assembly protein CpaF